MVFCVVEIFYLESVAIEVSYQNYCVIKYRPIYIMQGKLVIKALKFHINSLWLIFNHLTWFDETAKILFDIKAEQMIKTLKIIETIKQRNHLINEFFFIYSDPNIRISEYHWSKPFHLVDFLLFILAYFFDEIGFLELEEDLVNAILDFVFIFIIEFNRLPIFPYNEMIRSRHYWAIQFVIGLR